jgi:hypothetical protein
LDSWGKELVHSWEKREFIAVTSNPFEAFGKACTISKPTYYYPLNGIDLWLNFDTTVHYLFDFLDTPIDSTKLLHWNSVYTDWKKFHHYRILFMLYFDEIIDSILANRGMDLTRFQLDLGQEAAIQHTLLHKHNLNLKSWQLEKFTDTRHLHSLLEPNINHKLSYTV